MDSSMSTFIFAREETNITHSNATYSLFPWAVARNDYSTDGCPSRSQILVTFAVTNIINLIISVILGNRRVIRYLSGGLMGKETDAKHYHFLWILTVGLNLASSATNAFIMKNTEGYGERFDVAQVMLFYTSRPRITWIFAGLLTSPFARQRAKGKHWSADWVSFAYSQAFAEIVLQSISVYSLIAANLYRVRQEQAGVAVPESVSIFNMTKEDTGLVEVVVGSVGWVVVFIAMFVLGLAVWSYVWWFSTGDKDDSTKRDYLRKKRDWAFLVLVVTLACSWLFWDGYIREFPQEYCPPKLTLQATVWVLFTAVGIPLGAGL